MTLKWSESIMLKFIELYHNHDCLWNHRLDSYKNKDARENALRVIVREMEIDGLNITDVKNKIKTIRTMYKKELTMVFKSKKSGTGTDDVYKPKLFWFKKVDEFLRGVTTQRNGSSNLNLSNNETEQEEYQTEIDGELDFSATESESLENNTAEPIVPSTSKATTMTHNSQKSESKSAKQFRAPQSRKRKAGSNDNILSIHTAIDKLDKVQQQNNNTDGDEFDAFAKLIAIQLRQLPLLNALSCQDKIQSVIRQERLQVLLNTQSQTPSPSLSHHSGSEGWSNSAPTSPAFVEQYSFSPALQEESSDIIAQALATL